ncbi:putative ABC transport system permease protein [Salana multivorans]|uniref:Putative ABC transport system permease protein n=1 Tax=Salana multivorans TaxID=120377 RepID=A0A3N2DCM7_9MICO|nr:ABC transporter permease [Salana multivorans]MBN8881646.1 ABC transporter permease [Salana multivorans]OJX97856.1 MAG: ABC transporter [Micrococcales bacterium 73-15]ROR97462.1 putative ABC transport system permease protein [Salana multivorans]
MSGLSARDLLVEASHGIGSRPGRLVLTILGTVLGIAAVVVTLGMAQTGAGQIAKQFDAVAATQAVASPETTNTMGGDSRAKMTMPWNAPERVERLNGVEAAALLADVDVAGARISAVPVVDPSAAQLANPSVVAASPGLLEAVRATLSTGRMFDAGHDERANRVVVLGAGAAQRLGVNRVDSQPAIFIGDKAYTVIGILDETARRRDLLDSVILPLGTARADFDLQAASELQMRIAVGAGDLVAEQVPIALAPNTPDNVKVQAPRAGGELQRNVRGSINYIFIALGAVALIVGGLGIANVTLLSVMERVGEIGLRRALGATRGQVALQFIVESVVVGLLGGFLGSALGVVTVVIVSAAQQWTPIIDMPIAFAAAALGGVIGLVAGAYPAIKAASLEPVAALRGGL